MKQEFKMIPIKNIEADENQPRKFFDEAALNELTESIKEKGILQPILIRPIADKRLITLVKKKQKPTPENGMKSSYFDYQDGGSCYKIVCGERRFKAAMRADMVEIPAIVRDLSDSEALELQIIENLQRKDVHPIEEAVAFKSLTGRFSNEEIALRVGKSVTYVTRRIKLTDLIPLAQEVFYSDKIDFSDALQLARMDEKAQQEVLNEALRENWREREYVDISWYLRKHENNLSDAKFDTTDPNLYPEMGACTGCVFNSANHLLLFDEPTKKAICSKPACFTIKADRTYKKNLESVLGTGMVCITGGSYLDEEDKRRVRMAEEMGIRILDDKLYSTYYCTEPTMTFEEWKEEENIDEEDNYSEEELQSDYRGYVEVNERGLAEDAKLLESGKIVKALAVAGFRAGQTTYIRLKGEKGENVASAMAADPATSETMAEIARLESREARSKELDAMKVWEKVAALIKERAADLTQPNAIKQEEFKALGIAVFKKIAYPYNQSEALEKILKQKKVSQENLDVLFRTLIISALPNLYRSHKDDKDNKALFDYVKGILPQEVKEIELDQEGVAEMRAERLEKKLAALRKKLNAVEPA